MYLSFSDMFLANFGYGKNILALLAKIPWNQLSRKLSFSLPCLDCAKAQNVVLTKNPNSNIFKYLLTLSFIMNLTIFQFHEIFQFDCLRQLHISSVPNSQSTSSRVSSPTLPSLLHNSCVRPNIRDFFSEAIEAIGL